ncbi:MAG: transposase [Phycisphaerae bacterium]|nr:transposase [Gemmatimonadaceae bacterium]
MHITVRGNNRLNLFTDADDFAKWMSLSVKASHRHRCDIHAYVLMTNHVHFLATPASEHGPPAMMQSIQLNYAAYFNTKFKRSGTLFEGRYKSFVVDSVEYFFHCNRYIELNPVRALMVANPWDYPWSSVHRNVMGAPDVLVKPHALYSALGQTEAERQAAYTELFRWHLDPGVCDCIRSAIQSGKPISEVGAQSHAGDSAA